MPRTLPQWQHLAADLFASVHDRQRPRRERRPRRHALDAALRPVVEALEVRRLLAAITVTSTGDTIAVDGTVTLREAIASANADAPVNADVLAGSFGVDTIDFSPTTFPAGSLTTISMSGTEFSLTDSSKTTITGLGAKRIAIDGNGRRIFSVDIGAVAEISGLTLTDGSAPSGNPGLRGENGGAILVKTNGTLTLRTSVVRDSRAGAGLDHPTNFTSGGDGGGIANFAGTLTVIDSAIFDNEAGRAGESNVPIPDSTSGGVGGNGGGIWSSGELKLINTTISGNEAGNAADDGREGDGGGIWTSSLNALIRNCTIASNDAHSGREAIFTDQLFMHNTIIAGDIDLGDQIFGNNNLVKDSAPDLIGTNNIVGPDVNPGIGALLDNGGPTPTHGLLALSPAINAGSNAEALDENDAALTNDQRGFGFPRIVGSQVDIGAFETGVQLNAVADVDENGFATLAGSYTNGDLSDSHTVTINWGDPNNAVNSIFSIGATQSLAAGTTVNSSTGDGAVLEITVVNGVTGQVSFSAGQHQYLDDGEAPGNFTDSDVSNINVTVQDDDTGWNQNGTPVTVKNVAATTAITAPTFSSAIAITVFGSYTDIGLLDTHTLSVDVPGDPRPATFAVPAIRNANGDPTLAVNDTFNSLSDSSVLAITAINPTTGQVDFTVTRSQSATLGITTIRGADDDSNSAPGGVISGPTTALKNASTTWTFSAEDSAADEAADFLYLIDWGDGSPTEVVLGDDSVDVAHTYANATSHSISASVIDQWGAKSIFSPIHSVSVVDQGLTEGQTLTANLFLNLANTDDVGTFFDVVVRAYKGDTQIAEGTLNRLAAKRTDAVAKQVILTVSDTTVFGSGDSFTVKVFTRIDEGPGHNSGRLQLQHDAVSRSSNIVVNFGGGNQTFYLHNNVITPGVRLMDTTPNTGDTVVDLLTAFATKANGNQEVLLGTWTFTFP